LKEEGTEEGGDGEVSEGREGEEEKGNTSAKDGEDELSDV
jgi:hypothetical protein